MKLVATIPGHVQKDMNKKTEDTAMHNQTEIPPFLQTQPPVNAYMVLGWFKVSITKNNLENSLLLEPEIPNNSLRNFLQEISTD